MSASSVLPKYEKAELALIASLVDSPGLSRSYVSGLPVDNFSNSTARAIFRAYQEYEGADDIVLATRAAEILGVAIHDVTAYLNKARETQHAPEHIEAYVNLLRDAALRRKSVAILNDAITGILDTGRTGDVIIETMSLLRDVMPKGRARELGDVVDEHYAAVQLYHDDPLPDGAVRGLNTGLYKINALTGGLKPSLTIMAARPSVGKTALAVQIAVNAARELVGKGKKVIYFTNEMSDTQLLQRMTCAMASVSSRSVELGRLDYEQFVRYADALDELRGLPLEIIYSRQIDDVLGRCYREEPGLIVVDYLNKMHGGHGQNRNQELGNIADLLFDAAYDVHAPVLLLAQLSRNVEHRGRSATPQLADLRDSGELEQIADIVIMLDRHNDPDSDDFNPRALHVYKRKDRLGGDQHQTATMFLDTFGGVKDTHG